MPFINKLGSFQIINAKNVQILILFKLYILSYDFNILGMVTINSRPPDLS